MRSLALFVVLAACKPTDDHPDPTTHDEYIAANLVLNDQATVLIDLAECPELTPFEITRFSVGDPVGALPFAIRTLPMSGDRTLVQIAAQCSGGIIDRYVLVPATGTPVTLSRPFGAPTYTTLPDPRSVPVPGGNLIVDCAGGPFGAFLGADQQLLPVDVSPLCAAIPEGYDWAVGAADDGQSIFLARLGGGLVFTRFAFDGAALIDTGDTSTFVGPLDESMAVFVAELPDGRRAAVVRDPTRGELDAWIDGDGPFTVAPDASEQDRHPPVVVPSADGTWKAAVEPDGGAGGELWTYAPGAAGGARTAVAPVPPSELPDIDGLHAGFGAAVTVWHDAALDDDSLDSPVDIGAHALRRDGTYASPDVPSTPCDERYRCRKVGEPMVLGLAPTDGGGVAFYGLWDWFGYGGVYVIPVSDFD